jgi:hypothetical protein
MGFPKELWTEIIFKFLDGRDGSRLLRVCKKMKEYVESCKYLMYLIDIHWIEISEMTELHKWIHPESTFAIDYPNANKMNLKFWNYGYIGESIAMVRHEDVLVQFNDFYDIQHIHWEKLAMNLKANDYEFYMIKYPKRGKFQVLPFKEIHRDGMIIIKWKDNEKRSLKKIKV